MVTRLIWVLFLLAGCVSLALGEITKKKEKEYDEFGALKHDNTTYYTPVYKVSKKYNTEDDVNMDAQDALEPDKHIKLVHATTLQIKDMSKATERRKATRRRTTVNESMWKWILNR